MKHGEFPSTDALSRRATSARAAVDAIDLLIARGEFVPGQRLVEADLMARLPASRATVRAALQFLAGDGVVELLPNRGARIRRFDSARLKEIMEVVVFGIIRPAMEMFGRRPLTQSMREGLEERLSLIQAAAKLQDVVSLSDSMAQYNEFIVRYCGNAYLHEMLSKVHLRHYARQFITTDDFNDLSRTPIGYEEITQRLLANDGEGAFVVLRRHAERTIDRLAKSATGN